MQPQVGQVVTVLRSRLQPDAWRDHPAHRAAQRPGPAECYGTCAAAVGTTEHASSFVRA